MQTLISWNVASVRARLEAVLHLIDVYGPDMLFLQEIKATAETFPTMAFQAKGYRCYIAGQKGFNGVAILSKEPLHNIQTTLLPDDPAARFIAGQTPHGTRCINIYAPNGNPSEKTPEDTTKLTYKLRWFAALKTYLQSCSEPLLCTGDFNVIEKDTDVYNPKAYQNNALMVPPVRAAFRELCDLPLAEAIRSCQPQEHYYSFWDFQFGAWQRNLGMLLDRCLFSPSYLPLLQGAQVLKDVRGWPKTSDHAPIMCQFNQPI